MKPIPPEPPLTVLLGLPFHDLTLEESLDFCTAAMLDDRPRYLVTANVDFTAQAYEDPDLKKIVFFADRVVCDGMPLVWLSRMLGYPLRERVAGSDMVPRLLDICAGAGHGVYFFGSDLDTLKEAKGIVESRYPGLRVVGMDSPPVGAVIEWNNEELCAKMKASGAKLLLVCLGCPKQERWICAHHRETGIPLSIGVGASLDFFTGKQVRAPHWMQKSGLEWFWRMAGSPKRLASRYGKDFRFLLKAARQQLRSQRHRRALADNLRGATSAPVPPEEIAVTRLVWSGTLQNRSLNGAPVPDSVTSPVILDLSQVTLMDSSGLGRLVQLDRLCRSAGQPLVVANPSEAFRLSIKSVFMECLFSIVESDEEALRHIAQHNSGGGDHKLTAAGTVWVSFDRALEGTYYEEMMDILRKAMESHPGIHTLVVDLKDVGFIDSRAVGGLIRIWKEMAANGGRMFHAGATSVVREVIGLLKLDKVLAEWKEPTPP